jgi:hypothetical protein
LRPGSGAQLVLSMMPFASQQLWHCEPSLLTSRPQIPFGLELGGGPAQQTYVALE